MAIFSLGLYIIVSFCISYSVSRFTHFLRIYLQIKSHVKVPGVRIPMYLLSGCNSVLLRIQFKPFKIRLYGERKKKRPSNFTHLEPRTEKTMAPHSSTLAGKIPWAEEPGGLQSIGSRRVGHDWATSLSLFTFTHWRRKWQPTPVFLPGESQGRWSLVGCRLWGQTESDTTEAT